MVRALGELVGFADAGDANVRACRLSTVRWRHGVAVTACGVVADGEFGQSRVGDDGEPEGVVVVLPLPAGQGVGRA